eukprot:6192056-Pleurochrysis_carterae.AAC.1
MIYRTNLHRRKTVNISRQGQVKVPKRDVITALPRKPLGRSFVRNWPVMRSCLYLASSLDGVQTRTYCRHSEVSKQ